MTETVKRLYIQQIVYGGLSDDEYHFLPAHEQKLLIEKKGRFFLRDKERKKIKVVLTGGVFDIIHIGHIVTLHEARKHGDLLIVAVAKDEAIKKKGREPIHTQDYRKMLVESLKMVDMAVTGLDNPKKLAEIVDPDVIVYGYDQKEFLSPPGVEIIKLAKKIDDSKFKTGKILSALD